MKLYVVSCEAGIFRNVYTTVGENYEDVCDREIKSLQEKYGNAIARVEIMEVTCCNGYKVVLENPEEVDLNSLGLPVVFGRGDEDYDNSGRF